MRGDGGPSQRVWAAGEGVRRSDRDLGESGTPSPLAAEDGHRAGRLQVGGGLSCLEQSQEARGVRCRRAVEGPRHSATEPCARRRGGAEQRDRSQQCWVGGEVARRGDCEVMEGDTKGTRKNQSQSHRGQQDSVPYYLTFAIDPLMCQAED